MISRKDVNAAWRIYRNHHYKYREFDLGFTRFPDFIGLDANEREKLRVSGNTLDVSELSAARIKVLLSTSPENTWVMLKAAQAKYGSEDET